MDTGVSTVRSDNWEEVAYQFLFQGDYAQAASYYERAIEAEPDVKSYYWHLGLILLLQGQETEAQTTWLWAMADGEPEQIDRWTNQLVQVLTAEAERRHTLSDYPVAWAIRQHIREINPKATNNLLQIVQLSIQLQTFTGEDLTSLGLIQTLKSESGETVNPNLLLEVLQQILDYDPLHPYVLDFAEACLPHIHKPSTFINIILRAAIKICHTAVEPALAARFAELCLHFEERNPQIFSFIATFYQNAEQYERGIENAKLSYTYSQTLPDQIFANYMVLRGLMHAGGYWKEALQVFQRQEFLQQKLLADPPPELDKIHALRLLTSTFFAPYFQDNPQQNRQIRNKIAQLFQHSFQGEKIEQVERYRQRTLPTLKVGVANEPLKIGYLSHCFGRHSVGWLARWIFKHHDLERFEINNYFINHKQIGDPLQGWYMNQIPKTNKFGLDALEIADKIYQDEIDILVDLDSITLDAPCEVMALKPAPIQVTWLGWDASGLPAVDYFIADPYVLPESAQDYYTEKIWRLPQTYIAVDGFEVGVPTLRRKHLVIPSDAVVYLSAQRGYKRHRETARLQMQILKQVPNSYLLIKGLADQESVKNFFTQVAEEEGIDSRRLRFLPVVALEEVHRANLGIADVVLDTYPYNGATTTLETLWMCIPIVTRVGEQFAARNSYTMMMNVGVTEGIAWTDEEYVEWGIRLGTDPELRQQISWRLRQSKHTSPLWNGKQFTREMEKAYEQMWAKYVEGSK
ncbi:O-linked N-acetylglucosamine transferase, SPINDLY family protein [Coleofasciculus sp. F4-SAH-05]|uniref:O-linked N-acetylglucosamine transferase, SPINDLY family protein n=1 Tax=Coleofasciculus sp. F4-SAH-05 TaxID=3069525 RepID=UPI0032FC3753